MTKNNMIKKAISKKYFELAEKLKNSLALKDSILRIVVAEIASENGISNDTVKQIADDMNLPETFFDHEGSAIFDASVDETGRKEVEPTLYYQEDYNNWMIEFHTARLNYLLLDTDFKVSIWQTDDYYYSEDEESPYKYEDFPMFEAVIVNKKTEEDMDDTVTGRYCCIADVIDEIEYFANSYLN